MKSKEMTDLEEFLFAYASERFNLFINSSEFKRLPKSDLFIIAHIKAFIGCISNITEEISLNDLTIIVISASYIRTEYRCQSIF